MAQPDISQILAALRPGGTPVQAAPQPPTVAHGYPPPYSMPTPHTNASHYPPPQPIAAGNVDLSNIRPVNSGSLTLGEAADKERSYAGGKGGFYDDGRNCSLKVTLQIAATRHERREDQRHGGGRNYRDRSFSPGIASLPPRPPMAAQYGFQGDSVPAGSPTEQGTDVLMVDSNLVGLIIGRAGENLRRVEAETSTRVQFMAAGPDGTSPQRTCKITGTLTARDHAKSEIARIIEENGRERGMPDRSQAVAKQPGSQQPALRSGEDSTQMMVPNRTVGLIIGRGGETIRDLQERSGCHVNIVGEDKSINGLRPVNLIGTKEAAAVAKELILEIVDSDNKSAAQGGQANSRPALANGPTGDGSNDKINDSMMVPSEAVGMIIGKGGETIKDMQNVTGCKINVSQPSGRDIEREIGLIGSRSAIEYAKHAIMEKVRAVEEKNRSGGRQPSSQYDRSQPTYSSSNTGAVGGYDQRQMQYAQQPGNQGGYQAVVQQGQAADPYEAYGGYDNYMAMWTAYYQNQNQGQNQGQPGSGPPHS
ncbi:MAG: hypothetical protein LQ340_004703 [Diploschistes diacapsis]|nr:MAG: hypothetical protein LQ340_004703 [Diploschistes diacapsis]